MLRIDEGTKSLVAPREGTLVTEHLLERADFQEMIVRSWKNFITEIGFPSLKFVQKEVMPHDSVGNRIDILAFDEESGRPAIIELKRHRHKLQLLQALSYAAMVWTWDPEQLRSKLGADADEDLLNSIDNLDKEGSPTVILIAEEFDPEVVLTADWLHRQHGLDIYCFSVTIQRFGTDRLMRFQLDYPLRELEEIYKARRRPPQDPRGPTKTQTWEDIKKWIEYEWGRPFVDLCRRDKDGDPGRRRFTAMFPDQWGSYYLVFQRTGVKVFTHGRKDGDADRWREALPGLEVDEWGSEETRSKGLNFRLLSQDDAERFLSVVGYPASLGGS